MSNLFEAVLIGGSNDGKRIRVEPGRPVITIPVLAETPLRLETPLCDYTDITMETEQYIRERISSVGGSVEFFRHVDLPLWLALEWLVSGYKGGSR